MEMNDVEVLLHVKPVPRAVPILLKAQHNQPSAVPLRCPSTDAALAVFLTDIVLLLDLAGRETIRVFEGAAEGID